MFRILTNVYLFESQVVDLDLATALGRHLDNCVAILLVFNLDLTRTQLLVLALVVVFVTCRDHLYIDLYLSDLITESDLLDLLGLVEKAGELFA